MNHRPTTIVRAACAIATVLVLGSLAAACGDDEAKDSTTTTEAASGSSGKAAPPKVTDVWARPGTSGGNSAVYMTITAGAEEDHLVKATIPTDIVGTVELHETTTTPSGDMEGSGSMESTTTMAGAMESTTTMAGDGGSTTTMGGGMMGMQPVDEITIDADTTLELKPGGYHVMLIGLKQDLKVGDTIPVTLEFEHSGEVKVTAEVRESKS